MRVMIARVAVKLSEHITAGLNTYAYTPGPKGDKCGHLNGAFLLIPNISNYKSRTKLLSMTHNAYRIVVE